MSRQVLSGSPSHAAGAPSALLGKKKQNWNLGQTISFTDFLRTAVDCGFSSSVYVSYYLQEIHHTDGYMEYITLVTSKYHNGYKECITVVTTNTETVTRNKYITLDTSKISQWLQYIALVKSDISHWL